MSESHQLQLLQINSPRNAQCRNVSTSGTNPSQMTKNADFGAKCRKKMEI